MKKKNPVINIIKKNVMINNKIPSKYLIGSFIFVFCTMFITISFSQVTVCPTCTDVTNLRVAGNTDLEIHGGKIKNWGNTRIIANSTSPSGGSNGYTYIYSNPFNVRMTIDPNGLVGLGTTTPSFLLHLAYPLNPTNTTTTFLKLHNTFATPAPTGIDFLTYSVSATNTSRVARIEAADRTLGKGDLVFYTNNAGTVGSATLTERMKLTAEGNLGIGYATPSAKISLGSDLANTKFIINEGTANGSFGIGYQANQFRLHLGNSAAKFSFLNSSAGTEVVSIDGDGNVGIKGIANFNNTTSTVPVISATNGGLKVSTTSTYSWLQTEDAKPIALNPIPNINPTTSNTSYVAIGFIPGTYNVPINYKLAVKGKIICEELKVRYAGQWADFVFDKEYKLKDLNEVEVYITKNNHLPDVPSEQEIKENGIESGQMDATLLRKIEELTLYMIAQNKKIDEANNRLNVLENENAELKKLIGK